MALAAVTKAGARIPLAASHGDSATELVERLTEQGLTGSANPFADVWLETADGGAIRFSAIDRFEQGATRA